MEQSRVYNIIIIKYLDFYKYLADFWWYIGQILINFQDVLSLTNYLIKFLKAVSKL